MGMGDQPKAFRKPRKTMRCSKCGLELCDCAVRKCPHPEVNRIYGEHVCIYCCHKCKHKITYEGNGILGCELWEGGKKKWPSQAHT